MAEKPYQDEDWLRERWFNTLTRKEIADEAGCSVDTITRYARKFGFPHLEDANPWRDEERLRQMYHGHGMTIYEIADELGAANTTISKWMNRYGIDSRDRIEQLHKMRPYAEFFTGKTGGYEIVKSESRGEVDSTVVHRLVAVADGADPYKVFSGKDYHVHHKNSIPWDNRPANLEVMTAREHGKLHHGNGD